jgi:hypothetical protein
MFRQVVSTLFTLMEEKADYWKTVTGSDDVPILGEPIETEPETFPISIESLVDAFQQGYYQFGALWKQILSENSFKEVQRLAEQGDGFDLDVSIWAHILYDAASTYHCWSKNRFKLVEILTPLYYGRVASFARTVEQMDNSMAEQEVERQAQCFEDEKEYLIHRWHWAEENIRNGRTCGQPD